MPTLAELRTEAKRVHGDAFVDLYDERGVYGFVHFRVDGWAVVLMLRPRLAVAYHGRSKAAARRLALETLRRMGAG